jgi:transcription elongation factor Elf1
MHVRESHSSNSEDNNHSGTGTLPTIKRIALKPKEAKTSRVHVCHACNEVFKKRSLLNQHLFRVHGHEQTQQQEGGGSDFVCARCHVKCATMSGLRAHERAHLEKKFACGACAKTFLRLSLLREHLARKSCAIETRTCHLCHKVFADRVRKEIHLKTHYNDRAFTCTVCGKAFVQKRSLKEHLLTHETVRHYACSACGKQFVQPNHLRYHLASQHPDFLLTHGGGGGGAEDNSSAVDAPPFRPHNCSHCAKIFPFAYQLKRHERVHGLLTVVSNKASLQCSGCLSWFASPTLLREHQDQACLVLAAFADQSEPSADAGIEVILANEEEEATTAAVDQSESSAAATTDIEVILANEEEEVTDDPEEAYVAAEDGGVRWDEGEIIVTSEDLEVVAGADSLSQMEVTSV